MESVKNEKSVLSSVEVAYDPAKDFFPLGTIILDLEETDIASIIVRVTDTMVTEKHILQENQEAAVQSLMLKPQPIREKKFSISSINKRLSIGGNERRPSQNYGTLPSKEGHVGSRFNVVKVELSNLINSNSITANIRRNSLQLVNALTANKLSDDLMNIVDTESGKAEKSDIFDLVMESEDSTGVISRFVDFLSHPKIAFIRLAKHLQSTDDSVPIKYIFVVLCPPHENLEHINAVITGLVADKYFHKLVSVASSKEEILENVYGYLHPAITVSSDPPSWGRRVSSAVITISKTIVQTVQRHPVPPQRDPLKRAGIPFYGIYQDLRHRYPLYLSDITDGLSPQVLSAGIFIFFACLAAAITFGGMYADQTSNLIGVGETLLVTAINALIFAIFSCQPTIIIGASGPIMLFDVSLFMFCKSNDIDFLSIRVWIGIWMVVSATIISAFEGVTIVKKFTRFTEEIYATLVCLIYLISAIGKLASVFHSHPLQVAYNFTEGIVEEVYGNKTNSTKPLEHIGPQPNTSLLTFMLTIGTFLIAIKLKYFRNSKYLGRTIRRALGDFGVPIAIATMVLLDYLLKDTYTQKLEMPDGLQPTNATVRGWVIPPLGNSKPLPVWCIFAAAPASFLVFILVFIEGNICHLILSKPEKKMKKGTAFHWDLFLSALINLISGILGAPFMGPACVRTVSHVAALTETVSVPGESPKVIGVKEQRLSALFMSILVAVSVFLAPVLKFVPKGVLFGIFLYMGVSSLSGMQLINRIILMLKPVKYHPEVSYVTNMRTRKMHMFTLIQVLMLAILWGIKSSPASLSFPFLLLMLLPFRIYVLPRFFSAVELNAIDGKEQVFEDKTDEPDFYEEMHAIGNEIEEEVYSPNASIVHQPIA